MFDIAKHYYFRWPFISKDNLIRYLANISVINECANEKQMTNFLDGLGFREDLYASKFLLYRLEFIDLRKKLESNSSPKGEKNT